MNSEPRSDARIQKKHNMIHQEMIAKSPNRSQNKKSGTIDDAQDSAERAFFELQDAKVNFF